MHRSASVKYRNFYIYCSKKEIKSQKTAHSWWSTVDSIDRSEKICWSWESTRLWDMSGVLTGMSLGSCVVWCRLPQGRSVYRSPCSAHSYRNDHDKCADDDNNQVNSQDTTLEMVALKWKQKGNINNPLQTSHWKRWPRNGGKRVT